MRRRRAILVAGLALALSGCATLRVLLGQVQRPQLVFQHASATDLSLAGVTVRLQYQLTNPNDIALKVASLSYQLEVEGTRVTGGELPGGMDIPAKGQTQIAIPVRIEFANVPGLIQRLMNKSDFGYKVSGTVGVSTPIGPIPLTYTHGDRVAIPRF